MRKREKEREREREREREKEEREREKPSLAQTQPCTQTIEQNQKNPKITNRQ